MKTKTVKRFYCDFCGKGGCYSSNMRRHEEHCTLNPNRKCGLCEIARETPKPIAELVALLPDPKQYERHEPADAPLHYGTDLYDAINAALPELRNVTGNCPACIFAALRQSGLPLEMADGFQFKQELADFWQETNADRRGLN